MTRRVLLLGRLPNFVENFQRQLNVPNVELIGGAGVEDVRAALAQGDIDHVIVGGGLDLGIRLDVVKEVFQSSDKATVHLKDHLSGPEGIRAVRSIGAAGPERLRASRITWSHPAGPAR